MSKILNQINKWLFESFSDVPAKGLSAFRVVFSFYFLLAGPSSYARRIAIQSPVFYDPKRSLAVFFELPSQSFFISLDYLILILLVLVLIGYQTKWASILLGICFLIGSSFIYSFGKISHGWLLVMLTPMVLPFSNWGAYYSIDSKNESALEVQKWPVTLLAFLLGLAMFSAGLEKLDSGWLLVNRHAVQHLLYRGLAYEKIGLLTEAVLNVRSDIFWEIADYSVVFFELLFLFVVVKPDWFRTWAVLAIFFHASVWFFMRVPFQNNLVCYVIFINWFFVLEWLKLDSFLSMIYSKIKLWHGAILLILAVCAKWQFGSAYLFHELGIFNEVFFSSFFLLGLIITTGSVFYYFYYLNDRKAIDLD